MALETCSNCGDPVRVRRRSASGEHWCSKPVCRNAKQRFYYARRKGVTGQVAADLVTQLVHDLAHLARTACRCGLADAIPGWAHRDARDPHSPCYGVGSLGPGLPPGLLDAVHPDLRPRG